MYASLLHLVAIASLSAALLTPPTARAAAELSAELSEASVAWVGELEGEALLDDATFVREIRKILEHDGFTPTEQVDAFYLLHRKIGLHFSGFVTLPPEMSYAEVFWEKAAIMNHYGEQLAELKLDGSAFEIVARESYTGGHSVRLGSAVLLAALVDPPEAQKLLDILLNADRLRRASVPPIVAHYAAWSATIAGHRGHAEKLAELAQAIPLEEVREDFVLATGYRGPGPDVLNRLEAFAVQTGTKPQVAFDQATGAVLTVLHRHLEADAYAQAWQRVRDASDDEAWTSAVDPFRDGPPPRGAMSEPPPEAGSEGWIYKLWDGFTVEADDDAETIRWGETFSDTTSH